MRLLITACLSLALATPVIAQDAKPITSETFAADLHAYEGQLIAVTPCDIQPYVNDQGNYGCVLKEADGSDAKDPVGLPVFVFFAEAGLGQPEKDFMAAECTSYCKRMVTITGTASISEGTDYVQFSGATFTPL